MGNSCVRVSRDDAEISTASKSLDVGRDLPNLGADVLVEVSSYLPTKDLFELLLVSKYWNSAVMEGSGLWRKVDVQKKWNLEAQGRHTSENELFRRILGFAEDVSFSKVFQGDEELMMSAGRWLAPNLRILNLPFGCISRTSFPILASQCPLLESLESGGILAAENEPVHIHHPTLESLALRCLLPYPLTIDCPALTYLSTRAETDSHDYDEVINYSRGDPVCTPIAPSLNCPKLTSLHLRRTHCGEGVLESIAALAPNITHLTASLTKETPFSVFYHFKALRALGVRSCEEKEAIPHNAFDFWPLLESLVLAGINFSDGVQVAHKGLKSLQMYDYYGLMSPILSCPSLERLELRSEAFDKDCIKSLNFMCPELSRVVLGKSSMYDADTEPLDFIHGRVEELVLENFRPRNIRVDCSRLKKLVRI